MFFKLTDKADFNKSIIIQVPQPIIIQAHICLINSLTSLSLNIASMLTNWHNIYSFSISPLIHEKLSSLRAQLKLLNSKFNIFSKPSLKVFFDQKIQWHLRFSKATVHFLKLLSAFGFSALKNPRFIPSAVLPLHASKSLRRALKILEARSPIGVVYIANIGKMGRNLVMGGEDRLFCGH